MKIIRDAIEQCAEIARGWLHDDPNGIAAQIADAILEQATAIESAAGAERVVYETLKCAACKGFYFVKQGDDGGCTCYQCLERVALRESCAMALEQVPAIDVGGGAFILRADAQAAIRGRGQAHG